MELLIHVVLQCADIASSLLGDNADFVKEVFFGFFLNFYRCTVHLGNVKIPFFFYQQMHILLTI